MDKLHDALFDELKAENALSQTYYNKWQAATQQVEELTIALNKVTSERNGLYSDLDAFEHDNKILKARIDELEQGD